MKFSSSWKALCCNSAFVKGAGQDSRLSPGTNASLQVCLEADKLLGFNFWGKEKHVNSWLEADKTTVLLGWDSISDSWAEGALSRTLTWCTFWQEAGLLIEHESRKWNLLRIDSGKQSLLQCQATLCWNQFDFVIIMICIRFSIPLSWTFTMI